MFRGVQHINMDVKGRIAIPARQREPIIHICNGKLVLTIDTQSPCLVIYPVGEWDRIEKMIQDLPSLKPPIKRFQRLVLGYATELELDSNGRFLLPPSLREYARFEKKLVLVGQGNKLELWAEDLWFSERDEALSERSKATDLPEELVSLSF